MGCINMSNFNFTYKTKMDYAKEPRKQVTTTINKELFMKLRKLALDIDQPTSKLYDVLIMELFEDEDRLVNFINKVKSY